MFVSMNWINDFVDLSGEDLDKLISRFTLSTAEVEGVEHKGEDIKDVVVGEIISCEDHPDSDHLHVLKVDAGDKVYDVVCGAPNARAGIKTAFAKCGGSVCGMKIKSAKLRGVESFGMCCSGKELGISDDHSGILELDPSLQNGTDIKTVSESLGHATTAFTMDRYGHVSQAMLKNGADRMQNLIENL